jgi:predicted Holliday junction resolvase-like endonuclease
MRQKAREQGQAAARRHLRTLLPFFTSRRFSPHDVKVLFHPVEYVAFTGRSVDRCTSIVFIDRPPDSKEREIIQTSLEETISKARLDWATFRVSETGSVTIEKER